MLVDVKRDRHFRCACSQKEFKEVLKEFGNWKLWRIRKGFYHAGSNVHLILEDTIKDQYPLFRDCSTSFVSYGVCDSPDQFIERYEELLDRDPRRLFTFFCKVDKRREPKCDGWRWRKWGPYVGDKTPKREYLKDEDDSIKVIYLYCVKEVY